MRRWRSRAALACGVLAACHKTSTVPTPVVPELSRDTAVSTVPPPAVVVSPPIEDVNAPPEERVAGSHVVRIALAAGVPRVTLSGSGPWRLFERDGASMLLRAGAGESWIIESERGQLRATRLDGEPTPARDAPFVARPVERGGFVSVNGKRYRGEIAIMPAPGGVTVVNRLYIEDYLRGVVPLEMGTRTSEERAALEAQAIAARSYAYTHLAPDPGKPYDMLATVLDQVYGGVDAEQPLADQAVHGTARLVLAYNGRVVNAPYHSTCGGSTAAASEVWREGDEPYLQAVSDRVPGTVDRFYCDISPRFRWTRTFDRAALSAALDRYLSSYTTAPAHVGTVRDVSIESRTQSGRVQRLLIAGDRGQWALRGNDIRFVMRNPGGEILASTYFSLERVRDSDGALARLVVHGTGYGHGVGMCQWGAIGRARAGFDYRSILRAYYPGTVVAAVAE